MGLLQDPNVLGFISEETRRSLVLTIDVLTLILCIALFVEIWMIHAFLRRQWDRREERMQILGKQIVADVVQAVSKSVNSNLHDKIRLPEEYREARDLMDDIERRTHPRGEGDQE